MEFSFLGRYREPGPVTAAVKDGDFVPHAVEPAHDKWTCLARTTEDEDVHGLDSGGDSGAKVRDALPLHAFSIDTSSRDFTLLKTVGSPSIAPITFTGLAARMMPPELAGVIPKNRQKAEPGGQ